MLLKTLVSIGSSKVVGDLIKNFMGHDTSKKKTKKKDSADVVTDLLGKLLK